MENQGTTAESTPASYHSGVAQEVLEAESTPQPAGTESTAAPGELQDTEPANPEKSNPAGKMANKLPVIMVGVGVSFILFQVWGGLMSNKEINFHPTEPVHRASPAEASSGKQVFLELKDQAVQSAQAQQQAQGRLLGEDDQPSTSAPMVSSTSQAVSQNEAVDYEKQAQIQRQMMQEQMAAQEEAERRALIKKAMEAPSTVYVADQSTYNRPASNTGESSIIQASHEGPSEQPLKGHLNAFEASSYLPHTRTPAISPYEVKAGTVIPAVMITGINSQLPGQPIAQVSQNVYDSATGRYLLIPQGARLVGTYDNGVNVGQKRVMIAWNRIIYPDSSSLTIEAMSGQDQSGYAGFKDKVNNHTAARFGEAILLSAITAGVQLSQPRTQQGDYSYSAQQVMAGSLGMQMNQLGMQSFQNRASMVPTLTVRSGYRFVVMVSKDMVLPPWQSVQAKTVGYQTLSFK